MKEFKFWILLFSIIISISADDTSKLITKSQYEEKFLQKLNSKCLDSDNSSCVMAKLLNYMNKITKKPSFTIGKRITLLQSSISKNQSADVLFNKIAHARNAMSDDAALTVLVADKLWTFVKSRALRWKITDFSDVIVSAGHKGKINLGLSVDAKRAFIEGRGKMKNSGPLIAAVVLKGALLGILMFKALFLLAGKALLISKLSLLLASLIGVKKLLSGKPKHVSYEIVDDHNRYDHIKSPAQPVANTQTPGWQRALDITLDSFIENFAKKFKS